jgi:hypothetical protein
MLRVEHFLRVHVTFVIMGSQQETKLLSSKTLMGLLTIYMPVFELSLSGYGIVTFTVRRVWKYLPFRLQNALGNSLSPYRITATQRETIQRIGKRIGLDRSEINPALPSQVEPSGLTTGRRLTCFSVIITIIIILFASFLFLVATGNYPFNTPTSTYTPGTRYGSIKPCDFN